MSSPVVPAANITVWAISDASGALTVQNGLPINARGLFTPNDPVAANEMIWQGSMPADPVWNGTTLVSEPSAYVMLPPAIQISWSSLKVGNASPTDVQQVLVYLAMLSEPAYFK